MDIARQLWTKKSVTNNFKILFVSGGGGIIGGSRERCDNEGEEVFINSNIDMKCFRCMCQVRSKSIFGYFFILVARIACVWCVRIWFCLKSQAVYWFHHSKKVQIIIRR